MQTETETVTELEPVSNDGESTVMQEEPYTVEVTIEGIADLLFHRYSVEAVAEKAKAAKGSKAKKTDDLESYVHRDPTTGQLAIPGENMRMAIVTSGKRERDPSSTGRKSMYDLLKASIIVTTTFANLGKIKWDYVDQRRVVVQRNAISRSRPAVRAGWRATFEVLVLAPEYIEPRMLHKLIANAGKFGGMGDNRPTYGRFNVVSFRIIALDEDAAIAK